jgi:putative SOS response-associated peptidase YedK
MCINFAATRNADWVVGQFGTGLPDAGPVEVYPGFDGPLVVKSRRSGRIACGSARFGLIPAWAKDEKPGRNTYNARSETAAVKPSFRDPWRQAQYGLMLVDHFYEPDYETGRSIRWKIGLPCQSPFGIASLWERWTSPATGETVVSFTMLTVNADRHPLMKRFHKPADEKRTPVVIKPELHQTWIEATPDQAMALMHWTHMPDLVASPCPELRRPSRPQLGL